MDITEIVQWGAVIMACASVITAATPTPADDKALGKIYKLIEMLALNVGKAKEKAK